MYTWTIVLILPLLSTSVVAWPSENIDGTQNEVFKARATNQSTIEVTWKKSSFPNVKEVIFTLSQTTTKKDLVRYVVLDPGLETFDFLGLKPNSTYYIFMDVLKKGDLYDFLTPEGVPVTTLEKSLPSIRRVRVTIPTTTSTTTTSTTTTSSTTKTTTTSPTHMPSEKRGGRILGAIVASRQRKALLLWVGICVGAGFFLIVILSAFTMMCHRPWRKKAAFHVEMRDKSKPSKRRAIEDKKKEEGSGETMEKISSQDQTQEVGNKYNTLSSVIIYEAPDINARNTWGSEFDALDGPENNIYINTDPTEPSENDKCSPLVSPLTGSYNLPSSPTLVHPRIPDEPPPQTSILGRLKSELVSRGSLRQKDVNTRKFGDNNNSGCYVNTNTTEINSSASRLATRKTLGRSRSISGFRVTEFVRNTKTSGSLRVPKANFHNINERVPLNKGQFNRREEVELYVNC